MAEPPARRRDPRLLRSDGTYGKAVADTLHDAGHRVSVVNPAAVEAFARSRLSRTKTGPHGRAADRAVLSDAGAAAVDAAAAGACASSKRWCDVSRRSRACASKSAIGWRRTPAVRSVRASLQHLIDTIDDEMTRGQSANR